MSRWGDREAQGHPITSREQGKAWHDGGVKPPARRDGEAAKGAVQGKHLILGVIGAIMVVAGLLFWAGMTGGSTHVPVSKPGVAFVTDDAAAASPDAGRD